MYFHDCCFFPIYQRAKSAEHKNASIAFCETREGIRTEFQSLWKNYEITNIRPTSNINIFFIYYFLIPIIFI